MPSPTRPVTEIRLVNGSVGDPSLFIDYPGKDDALLFDAGENGALDMKRLGDLEAVFITHHHVDHFMGLDRIVRANLDRDKTLRLFGPNGTIRKVYDRIKSYEYQFFPFQKIVLDVHDLLPGSTRSARLECSRRFPEPEVVETPRAGSTIYESEELAVEAEFADHTVPCLSYALIEKPGYHPDRRALSEGKLKPGPWVAKSLELLRAGASLETPVSVDRWTLPLGKLVEGYFLKTGGSRIAYITDTAWNEVSRPGLLRLAHKAKLLYCDSFYAHAQLAQAEKHRHMTAAQAAELAKLAKVERLILIHFATRYQGRYEELLEEARETFPETSAEIPRTTS